MAQTSRIRQNLYAATLSVIFGLLLLGGMAGTFIPYDTVPALQELRALARPPSVADLQQPTTLPGKINAFFNDNFGGRKLLVREYFRLRLRALKADVGLPAILGSDGSLTSTGEIAAYRHLHPMPAANLAAMQKVLSSWCKYAEARGAITVLLVAPNKTTIYPNLPDYLPKANAPSIIDTLNALPVDCPLIKLDLRETLRERARKELLYFKWGSHWNHLGGLIAWDGIKDAIAHSGRRLNWPVTPSVMQWRPAAAWEDSLWAWFGLPDPEKLQVPMFTFSAPRYPDDAASAALPRAKVLAFGDSFLFWMQPTARHVLGTSREWALNPGDTFSYTPDDLKKDGWIVVARPWQRRPELIDQFKPNVVVLEFVERGIDEMMAVPLPPDATKAAAPSQ
jgi:hypothetical protein